jgi:transposase
MRTKRYAVQLTESERDHLQDLIGPGIAPARKLLHARILLKADQGPAGPAWTDEAIATAVEVSQPTVHPLRRQYVEEGLEAALKRRPPTRVYQRKLDGAQEAHLVALACSTPPPGQARWSLRLLAAKLVELEVVDDVSYQTVRRVVKKTSNIRVNRGPPRRPVHSVSPSSCRIAGTLHPAPATPTISGDDVFE